MKKYYKIKLIAASVAFAVSFGASAGLSGLSVQSHLGEPFAGSITATGDEAQALLNGGRATVSNPNLRTSVQKSGDRAVISIRSNKVIKDPVLVFQVGAGSQSREYTAIIDPAGYSSRSDSTPRVRQEAPPASAAQQVDRQAARERINRAIQQGRNTEAEGQTVRKTDNKKAKPAQTQPKQAQNTARPAEGEIRYGKRHLVKQGETLTEIATRIRPQGMTVEQTIQALVRANPGVFINKDADRMLAGKVLNIPTQFDIKSPAAKSAAPAVEKPAVADKQQPQPSTDAKASSEKPQAQKADVPATDNKAVENKADNEAKPSAESKPEIKRGTPAPMPASSVDGTVQNQAASAVDTEILQPGVAASDLDKAEPEARIEEALAAQQASAAQYEDEESDSGLWRWILLGGGALLALLLLLKLLGKRKTTAVAGAAVGAATYAQQDEDDDVSFSETDVADIAVAESPLVARAKAAIHPQEPEGLSVEDDFDDEVFFAEPEAVKEAEENEVSFDIDDIDDKHVGIVSSAVTVDAETEKRRDLDWDTVESTESVYEPEPENPYQPISVVMESREAEEVADDEVDAATDVAEEAVSEFTPAFAVQETQEEAVREELFQEETVEAQQADDFVEIRREYGNSSSVAEESSDLELHYEPREAEASEETEPLEFAVPAVEAEKVVEGEDAEAGWDFFSSEEEQSELVGQTPEWTEPVQTSSESEIQVASDNEDMRGFATLEAEVADEADEDEQPFEIKRDESLTLQDNDEDFGISAVQSNQVEETIEWENLAVEEEAGNPDFGSGFISESVGMTAPLEAKYELAKMYVEIGDPDAARETLQELVEDSDGDILAKTKALLEELDS